jgi:hypothetical protein
MVPIRPFRLQLLQDIAEIESEIGKLQSYTAISEFRNDPNSMFFVVGLVTNDLNLQNKAEMAFLPWAEPPASQVIGAGRTP